MMKNGIVSLSNTMASNSDDGTMTSKKLKPSNRKSANLDDSISSITSTRSSSKKSRESVGDDSISSIKSKGTKKKEKTPINGDSSSSLTSGKKTKKSSAEKENKSNSSMSKLSSSVDMSGALNSSMGSFNYDSYASTHSRYQDDDDDSDDDNNITQFMTPRQCLTPPTDTSPYGSKHKQIGTKDRQRIMAPVSPTRPVPLKEHRVAIQEKNTTKKKKVAKPKVDLNQSCPSLFNQDDTGKRNKQSKKVVIPNPKQPTKIKTTFLEDCSDSSDSEHEKERKRLRKEKKRQEKENALKAQHAASKAMESKFRRRSSIGPTVVPVVISKDSFRATTKGRQLPGDSVVSSDAIYCKYHHRAATRIAAIVRGHIGRMQYKIRQLQHQLETMSRRTDDAIAEIYVELEISKQEWEMKAHERFQKNIKRGDKTLNVHEAQDLINKIRNENTDFRERNAQLLSDLEKLRINNERLEQANKESDEFTNRLLYHQEVIELEHAKLMKVHTQYEESVHKHEEHLNLHISHGECETRARNMYGRVIGLILDSMDTYKDRDEQLIRDLYEMVEVLESDYGPIERVSVDATNTGSKKDKKSKKSKKK